MAMTPAPDAVRARKREYDRRRRATRSPEQVEAKRQRDREQYRAQRAAASPSRDVAPVATIARPETSGAVQTPTTRPEAKPVAAVNPSTGSRRDRDTRPTLGASVVERALIAAASAARAIVGEEPRLSTPATWGQLRQLIHTLGADDRAVAAVRLLLEVEGRRIDELGTADVCHPSPHERRDP